MRIMHPYVDMHVMTCGSAAANAWSHVHVLPPVATSTH